MKIIIKSLSLILLLWVMIYIPFAAANMEWNPALWDETYRGIMLFVWIAGLIITAVLTCMTVIDKENKK